MVLSTSAAASTQTPILDPTARTPRCRWPTYKALPKSFRQDAPALNPSRPTVSTIAMGWISAVLYLAFNYISGGLRHLGRGDRRFGLYIAFYYGLTGFGLRLVLPQELAGQPAEPVDARQFCRPSAG